MGRGVVRCGASGAAALGFLLAMLVGPPAEATAASAHAAGPLTEVNWGPSVKRAERFAKRRAGRVSFTIRSPGVGRSFRGGRIYASASVVKVMLMVAYLREHQRLSRRERATIKKMIRRSHNPSATRIRDRIGNGALQRLARKVGMRCFVTSPSSWGSTSVCSRDQAKLMAKLRKLLPARHRGMAMSHLRRIVPRQRWGIPEVTGWTPYFKGGWIEDAGGWRTHQIALLRGPGGARISLAVLSSGQPTRNYGRATVRGVAKRLIGRATRR